MAAKSFLKLNFDLNDDFQAYGEGRTGPLHPGNFFYQWLGRGSVPLRVPMPDMLVIGYPPLMTHSDPLSTAASAGSQSAAMMTSVPSNVKLVSFDFKQQCLQTSYGHFDSQDLRDHFFELCCNKFLEPNSMRHLSTRRAAARRNKALQCVDNREQNVMESSPLFDRFVAVSKRPVASRSGEGNSALDRRETHQQCELLLSFGFQAMLFELFDGGAQGADGHGFVMQRFIKSRGRRPGVYRIFWNNGSGDMGIAEGWNIAKRSEVFSLPNLIRSAISADANSNPSPIEEEFQKLTASHILAILLRGQEIVKAERGDTGTKESSADVTRTRPKSASLRSCSPAVMDSGKRVSFSAGSGSKKLDPRSEKLRRMDSSTSSAELMNRTLMDSLFAESNERLDEYFLAGLRAQRHMTSKEKMDAQTINARISSKYLDAISASISNNTTGELCEERCEKLTVTRVSNSALASPIAYIVELARWMQQTLMQVSQVNVTFSDLVCDFIRDDSDQWYLINVKGFRISPESVPRVRCWHSSTVLGKPGQTAKVHALTSRERAQKHAAELGQQCKLCGVYYVEHAHIEIAPSRQMQAALVSINDSRDLSAVLESGKENSFSAVSVHRPAGSGYQLQSPALSPRLEREKRLERASLVQTGPCVMRSVPVWGYQLTMQAATAVVQSYFKEKLPLTRLGQQLMDSFNQQCGNTRSVRLSLASTRIPTVLDGLAGNLVPCCYFCKEIYERMQQVESISRLLYGTLGAHVINSSAWCSSEVQTANKSSNARPKSASSVRQRPIFAVDSSRASGGMGSAFDPSSPIAMRDLERPKSASGARNATKRSNTPITGRDNAPQDKGRMADDSAAGNAMKGFLSAAVRRHSEKQRTVESTLDILQSSELVHRCAPDNYFSFHTLPRGITYWRLLVMSHCILTENVNLHLNDKSLSRRMPKHFCLVYSLGQTEVIVPFSSGVSPLHHDGRALSESARVVIPILESRIHSLVATKPHLLQFFREKTVVFTLYSSGGFGRGDDERTRSPFESTFLTADKLMAQSMTGFDSPSRQSGGIVYEGQFAVSLGVLRLQDDSSLKDGVEKQDITIVLASQSLGSITVRLSVAISASSLLPDDIGKDGTFYRESEGVYWSPTRYSPFGLALPFPWLSMLAERSTANSDLARFLSQDVQSGKDDDLEESLVDILDNELLGQEESIRKELLALKDKARRNKSVLALPNRPSIADGDSAQMSIRRSMLRNSIVLDATLIESVRASEASRTKLDTLLEDETNLRQSELARKEMPKVIVGSKSPDRARAATRPQAIEEESQSSPRRHNLIQSSADIESAESIRERQSAIAIRKSSQNIIAQVRSLAFRDGKPFADEPSSGAAGLQSPSAQQSTGVSSINVDGSSPNRKTGVRKDTINELYSSLHIVDDHPSRSKEPCVNIFDKMHYQIKVNNRRQQPLALYYHTEGIEIIMQMLEERVEFEEDRELQRRRFKHKAKKRFRNSLRVASSTAANDRSQWTKAQARDRDASKGGENDKDLEGGSSVDNEDRDEDFAEDGDEDDDEDDDDDDDEGSISSQDSEYLRERRQSGDSGVADGISTKASAGAMQPTFNADLNNLCVLSSRKLIDSLLQVVYMIKLQFETHSIGVEEVKGLSRDDSRAFGRSANCATAAHSPDLHSSRRTKFSSFVSSSPNILKASDELKAIRLAALQRDDMEDGDGALPPAVAIQPHEWQHISEELLESMSLALKNLELFEYLPSHFNWTLLQPLIYENLRMFIAEKQL